MTSNEDRGDSTEPEYPVEYIEHAQPDPDRPGEWLYWTKWYGYPDEENNLQLAEDMGNSADVVNSFWHDVGTEKCDLSQYPKEELETLRLLSSITWRKRRTAEARRTAAEDEARRRMKHDKRWKGKAPASSQHSQKGKIATPRKVTASVPSSSRAKHPAASAQQKSSKVTTSATMPTPGSSKKTKSSTSPAIPKPLKVSAPKPPSKASQGTTVAANLSSISGSPDAVLHEGSRAPPLLPGWKPLPSLLDATQEASKKRKSGYLDSSPDELPLPKRPRRNARHIVESDPEEENESDASSGKDPLFHDLSQSSATSTSRDNASNPLQNTETGPDFPQQNSSLAATKSLESHSDYSDDDEPLATTAPRKTSTGVAGSASTNTVVPLDTATKAYSRPIQPVVDKHRSKKIQFLHNPEVKPKNYGLPLKPQAASSKDRMSPALSVAATAPRGISSSSRAPTGLSPIQTDQPVPFADSMSPTFDLGPSSPATVMSPVTNSYTPAATKNDTKPHRKSAMDVTDSIEKVPQSDMPLPKPRPISSLHIAKKWRGGLYLNDDKRLLCDVYYEPKTTTSDLGLSLKSMEKLVAAKQFLEATFLSLIYPAFEPPQEYGALTGVDIPDARRLDKLVAYMGWKHHVAVIPLDKTRSAFFVLYPSNLANITVSLNISIPHTPKPSMILVMLQKVIPRSFPNIKSIPPYPHHWSDDLRRLVGDHPQYQRAARYFAIEPTLLDALQQCPFSVFNNYSRTHQLDHRLVTFNPDVPGVDPSEDIETRELVALLTRKRVLEPDSLIAKRFDWRTERPPPVMFIHANAWLQEGGDIPAFMSMRDTRTRFFKFGTVAGAQSFWSNDYQLHEVFPLGTILSFTADALIANLSKAFTIISSVSDDPTSQVYFHPDTLGVLERIAIEDSDDRAMARMVVTHIKFHLQRPSPPFCITYCPPSSALHFADRTGSADVLADEEIRLARLRYSTDQMIFSHKLVDAPDALFRRCVEGLKGTYTGVMANTSPVQPTQTAMVATASLETVTPLLPLNILERRVAETCAADLARMQAIPPMYKQYRKFVLIHGGRGHDEPKNLRPNEINLTSIAAFEWESPAPGPDPGSPPWEI